MIPRRGGDIRSVPGLWWRDPARDFEKLSSHQSLGKSMGNMEIYGKYIGNIWEIYWKYIGNIWEVCWTYMGNIWDIYTYTYIWLYIYTYVCVRLHWENPPYWFQSQWGRYNLAICISEFAKPKSCIKQPRTTMQTPNVEISKYIVNKNEL